LFEMECLPGFARSPDGLAIARRTAEMVGELREAIRESQQTIDETRELMRRLDLVIEHELVLKRT
jgi:NTP pyrophosphatase (non-canonical NTP hydrolase)